MVGDCPICRARTAPIVETGARWQSYLGEAGTVLASLEASSVDCIVTDPPYGTGANTTAGRLAPTHEKYRGSSTHRTLPDFYGDSLLPSVWREMMLRTAEALYRVAMDGAYLLSFSDWRAMTDMLDIYCRAGFHPKGVIVWDKGRCARPVPNGYRAQTEMILWMRKGSAAKRDGQPVYMDGVFRIGSPKRLHHIVEKPVELMRGLMAYVQPGMTVLDPFQGSGTTGVAALGLGARYIGIEKSVHYWETANKRLREAEQ